MAWSGIGLKVGHGVASRSQVLHGVEEPCWLTHPEVFAAGGPQLVVVARVVVDAGLGQHRVVLDLRPGQGRQPRARQEGAPK